MSLPRFDYFEAKSLEEAVALLKTYGHKARVLAGGTDLLGAMKDRVSSPEVIVDIKKIEGLDTIREEDGHLKMGALTGLRAIRDSSLVGKRCGLLQQVVDLAGSPSMRNMGTVGGNLCQDVRCWYYRASPWCGEPFHCYRKGGEKCFVTGRADTMGALSGEGYVMGKEIVLGGGGMGIVTPALGLQSHEIGGEKPGDGRYHSILGAGVCHATCPSDMVVALTGLGAKIRVLGQRGERILPVEELWLSDAPWRSLERDEIISEIQIPFMTDATLGTYVKFRERKALDFALVSVAAVLTLERGLVKDANIILGGVAPTPWRAKESEKRLIGRGLKNMAERAAEVAVTGAQPSPMSAYKVPLSKVA
ncbi:MAG: FAD binding domain-containing protein, partial [Pseudomonadota bacterium]